MRTIVHAGVLTFALTIPVLPWALAASSDSPPKANAQSLQHWREARLGMFIHWGPVSLTEKEISWSRANSNPKCPNNGSTPVAVYDNLYRRFNPTKFDARQWVAVAKAAGMKYMILTAKHCDGFLLWDSKVNDYNMLLNVGPMPTGEIAPEQVGCLKEMGAWLAKYGESIYGTRGGPFKPGRFGVSTRKGKTVYLHVQHWPGETLTLPAIPAKVVRAVALAGGAVTVKQTDDIIEVALPASDRQEMDTVVAMELDRPASAISPVAPLAASQSLATGKKATASNVFRNMAEYGPEKAVDGSSGTRWATDSGTKSAWLEVDLGEPVAIGRCLIEQAYPELQRVRKFAIEYWQDGKWQPCYRGENLSATLDAAFPPITAQRVRLNVTEGTDGPTIWEFELYPPAK